ncbi:MAG: TonB-dependent receptor [Bacteroidota bacterium]
MLRKLLLTIGIVLSTIYLVQSQSGTLKGTITDSKTKQPIPFANLVLEAGGKSYGAATTDFDGNYTIKPIPPGKYDLKAQILGYKPKMFTGVIINAEKINFNNFEMEPTMVNLITFEKIEYKVDLISKDQTTSGETITADEISKIPGRSAEAVAITMGGVFSQDGTMGSVRGNREDGTVTYIDGVKVRGSSNLPKSAIEEVSMMMGGLSAKFGEATGGVLNITTKGASREFGGMVEGVTSQFLDNFGYNLLSFSLNGPILKSKNDKEKTSLIGYFLACDYSYEKDNYPSSTGIWSVNSNTLANLESNPLRPTGVQNSFATNQNAEFIRKSDMVNNKARSDAESWGITLSGKIDVRTTNTTNLTIGGSLDYTDGRQWSFANAMFNSKNNGDLIQNTWRTYVKFSQRFPADKDSKAVIKNVFYQLQADYSSYNYIDQDVNHKANLFDYGYVGKFHTNRTPFYQKGNVTINGQQFTDVWQLANVFANGIDFVAADVNPDLANYTKDYYNIFGTAMNDDFLRQGKALLNGDLPGSVYNMYANTGTVYNAYNIFDRSQIGFNANASADIGNNAFEFGFQYEQLSSSYYGYAPVGLWTLMRNLTNTHIAQLDLANPIPIYNSDGVFMDTVSYNFKYDQASQSYFDLQLRKKLGLAINGTDWIDIDNLDPSTFSIDMFSADELLNSGNSYVNYYGYDYKGKKLTRKPSLEDFFTAVDENGYKKREIGAYEPIYMAGYIQDKFSFKDLIFNVGIRVDRFDANQKVLKDPYLLQEAFTVGEVTNFDSIAVTHPSNMGSNYVVYVDDAKRPSKVLGYRNGDVWYDATGAEITDPSLLSQGTSNGRVTPYLVDPYQKEVTNSSAFKDYDPQYSVMPRIAFSFPVSDDALFFAHYDIITKRPTSGVQMNPLDYLFIQTKGLSAINNPNLKPEKTVDYELGFQQKLNNSSSLKISAYYSEVRDLVQAFRFTEAYPVSYISYNNLDFGTTKGITLSYDLRRSTNIRLRANYTLQFANGTGSTSTSALALVSSGYPNLRTLNPLSFDQRHAIKINVDYRYGEGKEYNGPKIRKRIKGTDKVKEINLLQNMGLNISMNTGSGVPYSRSSNIYSGVFGGTALLQGQPNGSRLPWQFWIDARIDKDIMVKLTKKAEGKKQKIGYVNLYLEISNILNTKNVRTVYRSTGNPDDDGYLAAPEFQQAINSNIDALSFIDMYKTRVEYPYNYSLPRRIHLGVSFSF